MEMYACRISTAINARNAFSSYSINLRKWRSGSKLSSIPSMSTMPSDWPWAPLFRWDKEELIAAAPYLRRNCEDLDWRRQISYVRALASHLGGNAAQQQANKLELSKEGEEIQRSEDLERARAEDTGFASGVAMAIACIFMTERAMAQDVTEATEAASRVPAWLTPALLAFPIISYVAFSVYRAQINPYAKVTDWMFGVAAMVIIANLVLISTVGVRLY